MFPDCDDLFSEMLSLFPLLDSPSETYINVEMSLESTSYNTLRQHLPSPPATDSVDGPPTSKGPHDAPRCEGRDLPLCSPPRTQPREHGQQGGSWGTCRCVWKPGVQSVTSGVCPDSRALPLLPRWGTAQGRSGQSKARQRCGEVGPADLWGRGCGVWLSTWRPSR